MLKILELFAGVGGFRVGFEKADPHFFVTGWANQWESSRKQQHAFDCYNAHFPDSVNMNRDIATLTDTDLADIDADMIVGGFPCQDYSVARTLHGEQGIEGKKGVLFWEIIRLTREIKPKYLVLENVDRLLKSPSNQRGRDFAVMLGAFNQLGYQVEWRVINAADYGMAQRRRRVFFFISHRQSVVARKLSCYEASQLIYETGAFARAFSVEDVANKNRVKQFELSEDIADISDHFSGLFYNAGVMRNGQVLTIDTLPVTEKSMTLGQMLQLKYQIDEKYYLSDEAVAKFKYLRGSKKIERVHPDGHVYVYSEGGMSEIDELNKPARTMLTSEASINRSSHIVQVDGRHRVLTPIECERLNGFGDDWTSEMPDRMRYFCMGNALVTGIVARLANTLKSLITQDDVAVVRKAGENPVRAIADLIDADELWV